MLDSQTVVALNEKLWNRNYILIVLSSSFIFISFIMLMPSIPLYAQHLGATQDVVGLLVGISTVTAVIFRPFVGRAVDTRNRRNIYITGLLILIISILSYNFASTIKELLVCRLLHGLGWGIATTAASTIVADAIPQRRLGEGMGYYGLCNVLAMAIAPALGLHIIETWGYRNLFFTSAILVITGAIFGSFIKYRKIACELTPTYRSGCLGIDKEKVSYKIPALFEKKAFKPTIVNFFIGFTYTSIITFIALYAAQSNIGNIGIFFTVYAITLLISRPMSGRLVDKKGFDFVIIPGIVLIGITMLILFFANTLTIFLMAAVTFGFGWGSVQPSLQAMVVYNVSPQRRGAANSTYMIGTDLSTGIGAIGAGVVAKFAGYSTMYLLAVIPVVIGFFVYLNYGKKHRLK